MFLISNNDFYFYIDEIKSNYESKNKYIDFQYIKTDIEYLYYKIKYNFTFYVAGNYNLPADALLFKMNAPSFTVEDIQMFEVDEKIDNSIPNIQYDVCKVYKASIVVDISEDNFFNGLSNKNYQLDFNFDINLNSLNDHNNRIELNKFNQFMNELKTAHISLKLEHQNVNIVNKSGYYNHNYNYSFDIANNNYYLSKKIYFDILDNNFSFKPIKKLFYIKHDLAQSITIENVVLKLIYVYQNVQKETQLSFNTSLSYFSNNIVFELNSHETYFDKSKKEIIFRKGNNGISFPFDTTARYEISFDMIIENKPIKYIVSHNFDYKFNLVGINFLVNEFNDELINYEEIYIE